MIADVNGQMPTPGRIESIIMNSLNPKEAVQASLDPFIDNAVHATRSGNPGKLRIEYLDGDSWDQIASGFDDALPEQCHCFNVARWGGEKVENIAVFDGAEVIGGTSVVLIRPPWIDTGIAIVKWGPLWRKRGRTPELNDLIGILLQLQAELAVRRGFYLTVMPPADPEFAPIVADEMEKLGFVAGSTMPAPERYRVDATLDEPALRKSLSQKWRYNLKKAERHDFQLSICDDGEGYEEFIGLYETMLNRKQFSDSSAIYTLNQLMQSKVTAFRPRVVFAHYEGTLIAGAVIDLSGNVAGYLYGATDDRALSLNAGYALHWFIVSILRERPDIVGYDLGGNDLDNGLHQFKKGFVGKNGHICDLPPNYHYGTKFKAKAFGKTVFMLRDLKQLISRKLNR